MKAHTFAISIDTPNAAIFPAVIRTAEKIIVSVKRPATAWLPTAIAQASLDNAARRYILRYVPKYSGLDRMFHALGDSSRRAMVERLARGPASVSELAKPFTMALPTVVQHLGVLAEAGIVTSAKVGRVRTYQLVPGALAPAADWIGRQRLPAERRLDRLGTVLNRPAATTKE